MCLISELAALIPMTASARPTTASETPLAGFARTSLVLLASATIVLHYLFFTVTALLLTTWILLELIVALVGARFGLLSLMSGLIERHFLLLVQIFRSLFRPSGATFRINLAPTDAPALFEVVRDQANRLSIPVPQEIALEMSTGAWVEMRGVHQKWGRTSVGIGYDLLAGLGPLEVAAVLAHELSHAKLISRFYSNWLHAGLGRAARLAREIDAVAESGRALQKRYFIAELIAFVADRLTRLCARFVSSYSRQHEFAADRGAAELCGAAAMRSALLKLAPISAKSQRITWSERLVAVHSAAGLGAWIAKELEVTPAEVAAGLDEHEVPDPYSSHPSMTDRLAALPADETMLPPQGSSIGLLSDPAAIARRLATEISDQLIQQEAKDEKELRRYFRKLRRSRASFSPQLGVIAVVLMAFIFGSMELAEGSAALGLLIYAAGIGGAIAIWKFGRYRERTELPVPAFDQLMRNYALKSDHFDGIEERENVIEKALLAGVDGLKGKRARHQKFAECAYAALADCDYLRAHVASRLAEGQKAKRPESSLSYAIAAGSHHQIDLMHGQLDTVMRRTGLRTPSALWGIAWAVCLAGDHYNAEAFLQELKRSYGLTPAQTSLLAFCQFHRNKQHAALSTLQPLCKPRPPSSAHAVLLLQLLLGQGRTEEALSLVDKVPTGPTEDLDLVLARLRLHLLRYDADAAERELGYLTTAPDGTGSHLIQASHLFRAHRNDESANRLCREALQRGHYPEALIALASHALNQKQTEEARRLAWSALDSTLKPAVDAARLGQVFIDALNIVMGTYPREVCRSWLTEVLGGKEDDPLKGRTLVVFAPDDATATAKVREVLLALHPDRTSEKPIYLETKLAPANLQRADPVYPGVQYVHS